MSCFSFTVNLPVWNYIEDTSVPTGWTHVVLNYLGPDNVKGIRIYYDGTAMASDTTLDLESQLAGDGRVVVGRAYTDQYQRYASVQVDELMFFNQTVSASELFAFYN